MTTLSEKTILRAIVFVAAAAAVFLLVWFAIDVLLTIFGGILFAIFLRGVADLLSKRTGLSVGWSLCIVVAAILAAIIGGAWIIGPRIAAQFDQLLVVLPGTIAAWTSDLKKYEWGQWILNQLPDLTRSLLAKLNITRMFSAALHWVVFLVVIAFVGIWVSSHPDRYRDGLLRLIPDARRGRAREIVDHLGYTMRWWMIGRAIAMAVVGVLDLTGLLLLGFPLALSIALLSGVLTFIPYIGATLSLIPALLIALSVSPVMAFWVFVIHTGVQTIEGYVVTPFVQRRVIHLPPALTISAQFFLGEVAGVLGLMFATPLTAIVVVLVHMLGFHERPE